MDGGSNYVFREDGSVLHAKKSILETTSDVAEAAMVWAAGYERCVVIDQRVEIEEKTVYPIQEGELRIKYAREIYEEFVGESN